MSGGYDNTSPVYHARHWRNVPTEQEDVMEDFLDWLEYDDQSPNLSKNELKDVKDLVDAYLGRKMDKVRRGERELLNNWIKAAKETSHE